MSAARIGPGLLMERARAAASGAADPDRVRQLVEDAEDAKRRADEAWDRAEAYRDHRGTGGGLYWKQRAAEQSDELVRALDELSLAYLAMAAMLGGGE